MARPLRIEFEGAVYHITSRGNERRSIYKDKKDRLIFLDTLNETRKRYNWLIHTHCLMSNHYHLIIETIEANLSKGMGQLNGAYTQIFNKRHKRAGHLFQGRYKAILIQKDSHLLEASRYVVLNPVRAKIVNHPKQYTWSSYNAIAGNRKAEEFLTIDWLLSQFGQNKRNSQIYYKEFVLAGIEGESIYKKVKNQVILGDDNFIEKIKKYVKGNEQLKEVSRKQRYIGKPDLKTIFTESILQDKNKRNKRIAEIIYKWGYSQKEISDYLGIHYSAISKILSRG